MFKHRMVSLDWQELKVFYYETHQIEQPIVCTVVSSSSVEMISMQSVLDIFSGNW